MQRSAEEPEARFLTVKEAASMLRVNEKTLRGAIETGEVPGARRIGRVLRISRIAFMRWVGELEEPIDRT